VDDEPEAAAADASARACIGPDAEEGRPGSDWAAESFFRCLVRDGVRIIFLAAIEKREEV